MSVATSMGALTSLVNSNANSGPISSIPNLLDDNSPLVYNPIVQPSRGLILSPAAQPFPARLVDRIQSGQFIEMRELLSDNISLTSRLESLHGQLPFQILPGQARPRFREVPSIVTWTYCFLGYLAILTPDHQTRARLSYARLLIRESLRHGHEGWIDYDRAFRQQVAINPQLDWNTLYPGLQASTILGRPSSTTSFCNLCQECDHTSSQCALAIFHYPQHASNNRSPVRRSDTTSFVCFAWNEGTCPRPGQCIYRHVCSNCHNPHKVRDCPTSQLTAGRRLSQQSARPPHRRPLLLERR